MSEWKEYTIGDVCSRLSSGKSINASHIKEADKYPVYGGNGLRGFTDNYNFDGECAIIGRQGASCGNVRYFSGKAYMTEHAVVAVPTDEHNAYYLSCVLASLKLGRLSGQSAQPGIGVGLIGKQTITLPSLATQNRIASILSALDFKIAVNRRICENLEAQAQALFKHWFVDFAPFKDGNFCANREQNETCFNSAEMQPKITGKACKFVESELGMIPEGWRVGTLGDICSYSNRKVSINNLDTKSYYSTENMLPNKAGAVESSSLPECEMTTGCLPFDVLISNIRPYFKKIIRVTEPCGCSTDVLCFHPHDSKYKSLLYMALYDDSFFAYVMAGSKGTKMPRGDKKQIMKYPIAVPADYVLEEFSNIVEPMFESVSILKQESSRLSTLRDTLLPKLMSGQIKL